MNAKEIQLETVESRCRENVQGVQSIRTKGFKASEENKLKFSGLAGKSGECWKSGRSGYCSLVFHSSLSWFWPSSFRIFNSYFV